MSLKPCTDCGREVSSKAERCPNCGLKNPTRRLQEDRRASLLVAPSMLRAPSAKCRECGKETRAGIVACPFCGFPNPTERPGRRWFAATTLGALLALLVAAAWQFGLLDNPLAQPPAISTGFAAVPARRRAEPPRVKSEQFAARCAAPGPVYVYELAATPSYFVVVLANSVTDPARAADSLAGRYQLITDGYQSSKGGFVAALRPSTLSKLRCEPAVASIEEDRTIRDSPTEAQQ